MLLDIALEALRYFDRTTLEVLQMHSRYLRDLVNHHARSLPLRKIHLVEIPSITANVRIHLLEDGPDYIYSDTTDEEGLEMLFHYINNSFVHRLTLSFRPVDLPLPHYLRTKADALQCRIRALHIEYLIGDQERRGVLGEEKRRAEIDYDLVDFLGGHLKPTVYETSADYEFREDYAMLFTHGAMRSNVKHLVYKLEADSAPDCIFASLFGIDAVESCAIATEVDPRPWIGKVIEAFQMAERGTDIIRSVKLLYKRYSEDAGLPLDLEPLGQPRRTDVPKPHCEFITEWLRERLRDMVTVNESSVAELFVFENATSAKKLELFVWTVEQPNGCWGNAYLDFVHYAFLLRVVDM